jgi:hypothetical protein
LLFALHNNYEIILSPVIGFMIGGLISWDDYEDGRDYTIQCCLGFISITVIWTDQTNG